MFLGQELVTIDSGLTGKGPVLDLADVRVRLFDAPPITGRATVGGPNYMHVSLSDLMRWNQSVKMTDTMIRQGVGKTLVPPTVTRLSVLRNDLSYFGARRVYLAMFEAILLLEGEGADGPGGGLGMEGPTSFPGERAPLGGTVTDFSAFFATSASRDEDEPVSKVARRNP